MDLGIQSFSVSKDGAESATVFKKDGTVITLTKIERDEAGSGADVQDVFRLKFPTHQRDQVHAHKNRDGTYAYALGQEPTVWLEDEQD